ncbi:ABC transporter substrate-binding protein [Massilia sp. TS11]|uniref:substrate-binding periplasmic protein n=1 Tax=Massilia sp. TS11 TaxID=2908003 RepID=UPI001EDB2FEE|nr:transporter substrate-binding domain-containing protein [Massilia sp. TS11]MCG2583398.1 transporter substrate-binding domain-containing protein [Massilia sp. TS11]
MEPLPPFVIDAGGKPAGPFPEIVNAACAQLKLRCVFEMLPWRRAYALAERGVVDGIFVLARTPEREQVFHFTIPVVQSAYALFVRQHSSLHYRQAGDLSGFTLAAYGPSSTSRAAQELARLVPDLHVEIEVDIPSVLRKLAAGRYGEQGAALINIDVGNYLVQRGYPGSLRVAGEVRKVGYGIALSRARQSTEQLERFNAALHELLRQGTIRSISERYGLHPATP